MNKIRGFICTIGNYLYIKMRDDVYIAPKSSQLDPDGYPYGMLPYRGLYGNSYWGFIYEIKEYGTWDVISIRVLNHININESKLKWKLAWRTERLRSKGNDCMGLFTDSRVFDCRYKMKHFQDLILENREHRKSPGGTHWKMKKPLPLPEPIEQSLMDTYKEDLHSREGVLPDDYPVYWGYWYIVDGKPTLSDIQGTILDLKKDTGAIEVRRCDAIKRGLPLS
jgi:hypothetical protein